ncbi:MAG: PspC domain-containing protein [Balneolales bacterium]
MEKIRKKNIEDYFEFDESQLENTLNRFMSDEGQKRHSSLFNMASMAGFVILLLCTLYALGYLIPGIPDIGGLLRFATVAGGILVLFTGLGAFTRTRKTKLKKNKASLWNTNSDEPFDPYAFRQKKKLFRSRKDRKLFGVCGGLAEYFGIDATFVRVAFVFLALTFGSSVLIYIILAIVLPKENLIS